MKNKQMHPWLPRPFELSIGLFIVLLSVEIAFSAQTVHQAMSARAFVNSVGVNVHMEYTDGKYANVRNVEADLKYLGIRHVRDGVPQPKVWMPPGQGTAALESLASFGIKFDMGFGVIDLPSAMEQLDLLEAHHPGCIIAVEGANEINNSAISFNDLKGQEAAEAFQRELYKAVRSDPKLKNVVVYHFTGGDPIEFRKTSGLADYANAHPYPQKGEQPRKWLEQEFARDYLDKSDYAKVITESGYYTLPQSKKWGGVDGFTQAAQTLSLLFDAVKMGVSKTYLYELLDAYPDASGTKIARHFGLFDFDNVPKPAAIAIHNLTNHLQDSGNATGSLAYTVSGLPSTADTLLLGKNDHLFVLAIWNEPPAWDYARGEPITPDPVKVTVKLTKPASVQAYDPLTGGCRELISLGTSITVALPHYPILIDIKQ